MPRKTKNDVTDQDLLSYRVIISMYSDGKFAGWIKGKDLIAPYRTRDQSAKLLDPILTIEIDQESDNEELKQRANCVRIQVAH